MRVVSATAFGGPEVLELRDVAVPSPDRHQVRVEVTLAPVITLDTLLRAGQSPGFGVQLPFVPGVGSSEWWPRSAWTSIRICSAGA